jgi:hypothetical protein
MTNETDIPENNLLMEATTETGKGAKEPITLDRLQALGRAANTLHALLAWDLATTVPHAHKVGVTVEMRLLTGEQNQPRLWLPSTKLEELLTAITAELLNELDAAGIDVHTTLGEYQQAATDLLHPKAAS